MLTDINLQHELEQFYYNEAAILGWCVIRVTADMVRDVLYLSPVMEALAMRFSRLHAVRTQSALGRLRIAYAEPQHLGVDRFLMLLAAVDAATSQIGTVTVISLAIQYEQSALALLPGRLPIRSRLPG